jgi:hypothetical protein
MVELTEKQVAEMIFMSFCSHYNHSEGRDEIERTIKAILRASLIRGLNHYVDVDLAAYKGRWKITILPVLEGLHA